MHRRHTSRGGRSNAPTCPVVYSPPQLRRRPSRAGVPFELSSPLATTSPAANSSLSPSPPPSGGSGGSLNRSSSGTMLSQPPHESTAEPSPAVVGEGNSINASGGETRAGDVLPELPDLPDVWLSYMPPWARVKKKKPGRKKRKLNDSEDEEDEEPAPARDSNRVPAVTSSSSSPSRFGGDSSIMLSHNMRQTVTEGLTNKASKTE